MALSLTAIRTARGLARQVQPRNFVRQAVPVLNQVNVPDGRVRRFSAEAAPAQEAPKTEAAPAGGIGARMALTAEVLVSKIFPAGFGWQTASLVADQSFGLGAESAGFALMTGLGDFTGVFIGHALFYGIKNMGANFGSELQTGTWLATSAFLAGTAWQPTVNALTAAGLGFNAVAVGTGAITGACFLVGLRVGRGVYGSFMPAIAKGTGANFVNDAQLSVAIGGGTACFVGTDVSFGDANWLRPIVGVEETTPDLLGCVKAGTSTFLGFGAVQVAQNIVIPAKSCWTDP